MKLNKIGGGIAVVLSATLAVSAIPFSGITAVAAEDTDLTGNTMLQADEITLGKVCSGVITGMGDNDWYVFSITEPSKVNLTYAATGRLRDCNMKFIDATHDNKVLYSQDGTVYPVNATYYLTAGEYYLGLEKPGTYDEGTAYDIKVTATPCKLSVPGDGSNNAIGDAAEIELETKYNAQISLNDDIDYYTFDLEKEGSVTFDFAGGLNAVDWALYDNKDDLIKHGIYQKNDEKDSRITKKNNLILKPGKYTVAVGANEKAASYGQYTFSFNYVEKYNDTAANGIIAAADLNRDGTINSIDASIILVYYSYCATGGEETDMNKWIEENYNIKK